MKETNPPDIIQEEVRILKRIPWEIILVSLFWALVIAFLFDFITGLLVLAGGIVSAASFLWLIESLSKFFRFEEKKRLLRSILLSYILRLVLIMAVFSIIIFLFSNKAFAFMAGFLAIIFVLLAEAIAALVRMRKWKN